MKLIFLGKSTVRISTTEERAKPLEEVLESIKTGNHNANIYSRNDTLFVSK